MTPSRSIVVPEELIPADGRFGSGPARVDPRAVDALAARATTYLGTGHRRSPAKAVVGSIRSGLTELYGLPEGYEVVLGAGGTTTFWDTAAHGLIRERSQHYVFGEFSRKFAAVVAEAPFLGEPEIVSSEPGTHPNPTPHPDVDAYALTHNETSTGVAMEVSRLGSDDALVLVDATSAAGAYVVDPLEFDAYYFSPQKALGSEGGLWLALMSPGAVARIQSMKREGRWIPQSLDLSIALKYSRLDETHNTPALATLFFLSHQIDRIAQMGGLAGAEEHCRTLSGSLYRWAEGASYAQPFVADPSHRSHTTVTVDLDPGVSAAELGTVLAANGIFDIGGYRKLGRNQLRIGTFPNVSLADIEQLMGAIDYVVDRL